MDDAAIDAAPGDVKVTVFDEAGAVAASMPVVFLNADNSVAAMTVTDAQGVAVASMLPGGSVTAQRPVPSGTAGDAIYTFMGVKPGDELVVGDPPLTAPTTFDATFLLPSHAGGEFYNVETNCGTGGSAGGSTSVIANLSCTSVNALVTVRDNNVDTLGVFYVTGLTVTSGQTVDLTAQVWKGYKQITVTIDNVPLDTDDSPNFIFGDVIGPYAAETWGSSFTFTTMGSVKRGTATLNVYDIQALDVIYNVLLYRSQPSNQQIAVRLAGGQDVTIDVGPKLLPWFVTSPGADAATSSMTWSQSAGAAPDYVRMRLLAVRSDTTRYTWRIASPANAAGVLTLPTLPGSFAAYNLQPSTSIAADQVFQRRVPNGWDSVRECAFSSDCFFPPHAQGDYSVASGPDGIVP